MKHKDSSKRTGHTANGDYDSYESQPERASTDPTGTRLRVKLSEIVMRPRRGSPQKKRVTVETEAEQDDLKLFYSISDGGE